MDFRSVDPALACTSDAFNGCLRTTNELFEDRNGKWVHNALPAVYSGLLRTRDSVSFTYGHVTIVAKMPKGDYLWPALWLLPVDDAYGMWPTSGEIGK